MAKIQHVHKALRYLNKNDSYEGNSSHLDSAVKALTTDKGDKSVRQAIRHIERHDNTAGNSPLVDDAIKALYSSLGKDN